MKNESIDVEREQKVVRRLGLPYRMFKPVFPTMSRRGARIMEYAKGFIFVVIGGLSAILLIVSVTGIIEGNLFELVPFMISLFCVWGSIAIALDIFTEYDCNFGKSSKCEAS